MLVVGRTTTGPKLEVPRYVVARQKRKQLYRPVNPARIGDVIRQHREDRDISQTELAALIHVSQATIARYESGRRIPGGPELLDLMALLGFGRDDVI